MPRQVHRGGPKQVLQYERYAVGHHSVLFFGNHQRFGYLHGPGSLGIESSSHGFEANFGKPISP